ncbi:MAG: glycosyl transferase, group 1 [Nocardioidaceae bacterium]|nr:glycosyl transferase, group 1 [Nocardioidaceae bacterium]
MRILVASPGTGSAGAERQALELAIDARDTGHLPTLAVSGTGPLLALADRAGIPYVGCRQPLWMGRRHARLAHLVGWVRTAQAVGSVLPAYVLLRRLRPDLVVTSSAAIPTLAIAAHLARIPHVWMVSETVHTNPSLRSGPPKRTLARLIARLSTRMVFVSRFVRSEWQDAAGHAAPDEAIAYPRPTVVEAIPRAAGPVLRLLMAGTVAAEKGQLDAVAALALARQRGASSTLRLVGSGPEEYVAEVRAAIRRASLEQVCTLEGWADEVGPLYGQADVTLMLSEAEAYGRVTAEAVMSGCPVLGYATGATPEVLRHGGGVLVPADVGALADEIVRLANDPDLLGSLTAQARTAGAALAADPSQWQVIEGLLAEPATDRGRDR